MKMEAAVLTPHYGIVERVGRGFIDCMEDFYFVCEYDISSSLFFILLVLKENYQINLTNVTSRTITIQLGAQRADDPLFGHCILERRPDHQINMDH